MEKSTAFHCVVPALLRTHSAELPLPAGLQAAVSWAKATFESGKPQGNVSTRRLMRFFLAEARLCFALAHRPGTDPEDVSYWEAYAALYRSAAATDLAAVLQLATNMLKVTQDLLDQATNQPEAKSLAQAATNWLAVVIPIVAHFANIFEQKERTKGYTRRKFICKGYNSYSP